MAVSTSEIGWGSYDAYEGPFFWGRVKYSMPESASFEEKLLAVTTSTEGGTLDAVNMYDRCILTVGVIQYCEAVFALSKMMGHCVDSGCAGSVRSALSRLPVPLDIVKSPGGWRFSFLDGRGLVDSPSRMQAAFLGGSTGLKGQWSDSQKAFARSVAASFASMWYDESMRRAQASYASSTLLTFVTSRSKSVLSSVPGDDGWSGALKAVVTSYSANLPAVAEKLLVRASSDPAWNGSEQDRFAAAARSLAFGSGIKIWPERYSKIAPVVSKIFGVSVPSLKDLSNPSAAKVDDPLDTVVEVQRFLISQGYDLGPSGADGVFGKKSTAALKDFQVKNGLTSDGIYGPNTKAAMMKVLKG